MKEKVHFKLVGTTGCGKTTLMTRAALQMAEAEDCGVAVFYPHADQAETLLMHLEDRNLLHRVVVKDLRDMKRVLPTALIRRSYDPDPFERKRQNHEYRDGFLSVVMRRRGDEVLSTRPAIERYAKLAVSVYQHLDSWLPASMTWRILVKDDQVQKWAIQHCTDELLRSELSRASLLNMHDQAALLMPAERFLFSFFEQAYVEAMTSVTPTVDVPYWLRHRGIYICIGGGSVDAIKTVMATDFQQIIFDAKESPCDTIRYVFMDEVTNYQLFQRMEAEALATVRFRNVFCRMAIQEYDFADEETGRKFRQNTSSYIFRQGNPEMAEECAKDLIALTDEYKIHHTDSTVRQLHGGFKDEEKTSIGTSMSGDQRWESRTTSKQRVAQDYQTYTEERPSYQQGIEQVFWHAKSLREMPDLQYWKQVRHEKPTHAVVKFLARLCVPDDTATETRRCLQRVKSAQYYREPVMCPPPQPDPPPEEPQKTGGSGMKRRDGSSTGSRPQPKTSSGSGSSTTSRRRRGS